jgi:hypothetical protein
MIDRTSSLIDSPPCQATGYCNVATRCYRPRVPTLADSTWLVVGRLVSLAVNEPVTKVRESALNSISEAFNHQSLPLSLVQPLAAAMPTMEPRSCDLHLRRNA